MGSPNIKNKKKKYKALILDVDGTLIPNKRDGMPSRKVKETINNARKIIHIGIATSRPIPMLSHIFKHLELSGPSIINSGARIIDASSKQVIKEQLLLTEDIKKIFNIIKKLNTSFLINDDGEDLMLDKTYIPRKPLSIYSDHLSPIEAQTVLKEIADIPTIVAYEVLSWIRGKIKLSITHTSATKQHGILEVAKILDIETHEIIGVGDGYNDFPLLMACGLKVAMGNAVEDLKAIADYIAPTVEEDGVADVIEKFILP